MGGKAMGLVYNGFRIKYNPGILLKNLLIFVCLG